MSPEQTLGEEDLDGRSDLYSLACVLYEMLGGQPPFTGSTVESIVNQHVTAEPIPITAVRPAVPAPVSDALMRALAKTPADRFSPAAQFADALRVSEPTHSSFAVRPAQAPWSPVRVATTFTAVGIAVLALVWVLLGVIGLPDWAFFATAGLLAVGFGMMVTTSVVERGRIDGPEPTTGVRSWLTWRNSLLGGVVAFAVLGVATGSYLGMRAMGVGRVGTLVAKGVIAERGRIILADFENRTADPTNGATVTELMRIGLRQSPTVTVLDPAQVGRILELMRRDVSDGMPPAVAFEAAQREGIEGVITGEVTSVGSGLLIAARVATPEGDVLTAQQETAADADELVAAVDRLSSKLRERIGESLRSIRGSKPLDRVTTESMGALRLYSQGMQAWGQGDIARSVQLLEDAIASDSTFAMAHRKLAIILSNNFERRSRQVEAATKAYEYRDRLTDRERYTVTAAYHSVVTGNRDQTISAYRSLLDLYPDDNIGLNNLGVIYYELRDRERAAEYYARALEVDPTTRLYFSNLASVLGSLGKWDSARTVLDAFEQRFPGNPEVLIWNVVNAAQRKSYDETEQLGDSLMLVQRGTAYWESTAAEWLATLSAMQGKLSKARQGWARAYELEVQRDLAGQYLFRASRRAVIEALVEGDPAAGLRILEEATTRYPPESLSPLDRPYGHLALAYAVAGNVERARNLIAEYDQTPEADHAEDAEMWRDGALGTIALVERRYDDAVDAFWQFDQENECQTCSYAWLARTLDEAGQSDSAMVLMEEFVNFPSAEIWYDAAHLAHGYRRLGEYFEASGDIDKAIDYYSRFVDLWKDADAQFQPELERVESAISRLTEEPRR
jgi:tetratricopeptide (TPR) repeat protein